MKEVQWQEWGKETFEKARSTGRPILLDITGSWCHWCHVMDDTSYSDSAIVDTINRHFIPVRVDTDKRPDVNRRYNLGGWPTTAFLDADGKVITGGTYIPPLQMRELLRSVLDFYAKNKGKAGSKLESIRVPKPTGDPMTERITKDIATSIAVNFDIDYGGFGSEPKFAHTDALELALSQYLYHGEHEMLTVLTRTLDKMATGGIYDRVEGGFFRYSTTRDWRIPHFEKMAEDNAKLLAVYLRAYRATGNEAYKQVAEGIVQYTRNNLTSQNTSGFFGSQDADEKYYKLDLEARRKTDSPRVDRTLYSNYNSYFISSFLLASVALNAPDLSDIALKSLDELMSKAWNTDGLLHYWGGAGSDLRGLLVDQASAVNALLDAYEYSGSDVYVREAVEIAEHSLRTLHDDGDGGFYDIPESQAQLGELKVRDKPIDENSTMAYSLMRLSHVTGDEKYSDIAGKCLRIFAADYERLGIMAASYANALDAYLNGPITITIVGRANQKSFAKFKTEALRTFSFKKSILYLDPSKVGERVEKLGYQVADSPTAYVCVGKTCGPPAKEPSHIESTLLSLLRPVSNSVDT